VTVLGERDSHEDFIRSQLHPDVVPIQPKDECKPLTDEIVLPGDKETMCFQVGDCMGTDKCINEIIDIFGFTEEITDGPLIKYRHAFASDDHAQLY